MRLHLCTAVASNGPNGHSLDSGWKNVFWNCGGMILIGENLSKCHWAHHKFPWAALESNPVLCGEKTGFLLFLPIHLRIYPSLFLHYFLLRRISIIFCIPIWTKKYRHCQHHNYTSHHQRMLKPRWCILRLCLYFTVQHCQITIMSNVSEYRIGMGIECRGLGRI